MKRAILLTIFFLMGISDTVFPQQNDNRLIRQLIDQETRYFAERNFEGWSSCWIQTPGALFTCAGSEGYNKIQGARTSCFRRDGVRLGSTARKLRAKTNWRIKNHSKLSWPCEKILNDFINYDLGYSSTDIKIYPRKMGKL